MYHRINDAPDISYYEVLLEGVSAQHHTGSGILGLSPDADPIDMNGDVDIASTKKILYNTVQRVSWGTGTPESAVTAPVGSLFLRTDGGAATTLYVKESGSGNTGWVGK